MEYVDFKEICQVEGCVNLGEINKKHNGKVYRRKYCSKHKRDMYGMGNNFNQKLKLKKILNKCVSCGWEGPCDKHRPIAGSSYNLKNIVSLCPNCHRLYHRGYITNEYKETKKYKDFKNGIIYKCKNTGF